MAGSDNLGDVVYESMLTCAAKMGVATLISRSMLHDFAEMVDDDIRRQCGSDRVYVSAPSRHARDMRVLAARKRGQSIRDIARSESVARSTVSDICTRYGYKILTKK
jgi:hypothetical protein